LQFKAIKFKILVSCMKEASLVLKLINFDLQYIERVSIDDYLYGRTWICTNIHEFILKHMEI